MWPNISQRAPRIRYFCMKLNGRFVCTNDQRENYFPIICAKRIHTVLYCIVIDNNYICQLFDLFYMNRVVEMSPGMYMPIICAKLIRMYYTILYCNIPPFLLMNSMIYFTWNWWLKWHMGHMSPWFLIFYCNRPQF